MLSGGNRFSHQQLISEFGEHAADTHITSRLLVSTNVTREQYKSLQQNPSAVRLPGERPATSSAQCDRFSRPGGTPSERREPRPGADGKPWRHTTNNPHLFLERFSGHQRQFLLHASSIIEVVRAGHVQ
jgi:hypothetical protein